MDWGLQNRLARIIRPATGHTVMLAVDHGYFLGPTSKLENPRSTIAPLLSYADALMPTRGVLRTSVDPATQTPIVLRVSGGTSIIGPSLADEEITTTFEEAIRMNVSAVALSIFVGTEYEHQTLMNLADLVNEGETYGIPVLAVGKIFDIYLGRGISHSEKARSNADGMAKTLAAMDATPEGLIFTNLVDFDALYGHRNDVEGYAAALEAADAWVPSLLERLQTDDLLIFTADHGNDPTTPSTDHSREYVPLLVYGPRARRGRDLGARGSLADIGGTVAHNFDVHLEKGTSFLDLIL